MKRNFFFLLGILSMAAVSILLLACSSVQASSLTRGERDSLSNAQMNPADQLVGTESPTITGTSTTTQTSTVTGTLTPTDSVTPTETNTSTITRTLTVTSTLGCDFLENMGNTGNTPYEGLSFQNITSSDTGYVLESHFRNVGPYDIYFSGATLTYNASWHNQLQNPDPDHIFDLYGWGSNYTNPIWDAPNTSEYPISHTWPYPANRTKPGVLQPGANQWFRWTFDRTQFRFWITPEANYRSLPGSGAPTSVYNPFGSTTNYNFFWPSDFNGSISYDIVPTNAAPTLHCQIAVEGKPGPVINPTFSPGDVASGPFYVRSYAQGNEGGAFDSNVSHVYFFVYDAAGVLKHYYKDTGAPFCLFSDQLSNGTRYCSPKTANVDRWWYGSPSVEGDTITEGDYTVVILVQNNDADSRYKSVLERYSLQIIDDTPTETETPTETATETETPTESIIPTLTKIITLTGTPSVPVLSSPGVNALLHDYTPLFNWADVRPASATTYEFQLAEDDAFEYLVPDASAEGLTSSQYTLPFDLVPNRTWYWRVRAVNALGTGEWSSVRYFRTALSVPELISPDENEPVHSLRPGFDWQDVEGSSGYTIQVSNNPVFSPNILSKAVTTSEYTPMVDLPMNAIFYWRVKANGPNASSWSAARSFLTPAPPSIPVPILPVKGALVSQDITSIVLDWDDSTVIPDASPVDHYQLQLDDDLDFSSPVFDALTITQSEYGTESLEPNRVYYWRVRSWNTNSDFSAWSAIFNFKVKLPGPTINSPLNSEYIKSLRPTFNWEEVPEAVSYTIQVSEFESFSPLLINKTVIDSEYLPVYDLPKGKILNWRVRANGLYKSDWSVIWGIQMPIPPNKPVLISPTNGAALTSFSDVTLDWKDCTIPEGGAPVGEYQVTILDATDIDNIYTVEIIYTYESNAVISYSMEDNHTYRWSVQCLNTNWDYSSPSSVFSFSIVLPAP